MTELVQAVESLHIEQAARGAEVAVKVREPARRHDQVYCVRMGEQPVEEPRARLCLAATQDHQTGRGQEDLRRGLTLRYIARIRHTRR